MLATMAGPRGVAKRGHVIEAPAQLAKELLEGHYAREYREDEDAKKPFGMQAAKDNE
jgi:hypothetical protein